MRTYDDIKKLHDYANEIKENIEWYNKTIKTRSFIKTQKKMEAKIDLKWYIDFCENSPVHRVVNKHHILDEAVSSYLTLNFDKVMTYCSEYIKDELKKDIDNIEKQQSISQELISKIK